MQRKQTIIEELMNMGSLLYEHQPAEIYQVPENYFEHLPNLIVFRISVEEDLDKIKLSETYQVHPEYFESFPAKMLNLNKEGVYISVSEELAALSPLLSGLKKETPYTVKENYFEGLSSLPLNETDKKEEARIIPFFKPKIWLRYAAAAIVIGIVGLSGIWIYKQNSVIDPVEDPYAWVKEKTKKISNDDLESFIELANIETSAINLNMLNPVKSAEMNELMNDVPDAEIIEFLNETPGTENNTDLILN